jgi:hypothetical protein
MTTTPPTLVTHPTADVGTRFENAFLTNIFRHVSLEITSGLTSFKL